MLTMKEYVEENYSDDIENWENMTPRDRLDEYIYNELNVDFSDDFFEVETVEQCINSCNKALKDKELKNMKDEIEDTIRELEVYKDKGLFCKFVMDTKSCLLGQCYVIFTEKYEYLGMIRVI